MAEEQYIGIPEVAKRLHYNPSTIRKQAKEGKIPSIQIGREYRIAESWLDEQLGKATGKKKDPSAEGPEVKAEPAKAEAHTEVKANRPFHARASKVGGPGDSSATGEAKKAGLFDDYDSLYSFGKGGDNDDE